MAVNKNNSKSLRCSDDFLVYVDRAPGDGFSDKVDYIVTDYYKSIDKREERIKELDRKIKQKELELQKLEHEVAKVENVIGTLTELGKTVKRATSDIFDKAEKFKTGIEAIQN